MALASRYFNGKRVSRSHYCLLREAERRGIVKYINQGRRTIAEQRAFWNHYKTYGYPLAAYPSYAAPHIKFNRENHALDINDGVVDRVASFYRSLGVPVAFNVPSEPWHMDTLSERVLIDAAKQFRYYLLPQLRRGQTGKSVIKLKKLLYNKGYRKFGSRYNPFFSKATQNAVKRFQKTKSLKADGVVGPRTWKYLGA